MRSRPPFRKTKPPGPGCPHSKHGRPEQCSLCIGATPQRLAPIDYRRQFGDGLHALQKLAALDALIGEDPEASVEIEAKPEADLSVPPP
jgi:hypothetical protein